MSIYADCCVLYLRYLSPAECVTKTIYYCAIDSRHELISSLWSASLKGNGVKRARARDRRMRKSIRLSQRFSFYLISRSLPNDCMTTTLLLTMSVSLSVPGSSRHFTLQWNPTLVASLFKGYPHLRDNTVWSQIFSGFSNVKNPLFKEPLFKGYSDLRDKFLKISLILGKFDEFWQQKNGILR